MSPRRQTLRKRRLGDTQSTECNVPNQCCTSEICLMSKGLPHSHGSVASQRGRREPNLARLPHADSSGRNFGTRCSVSCCFSSFLALFTTLRRQSAHRLPSQSTGKM